MKSIIKSLFKYLGVFLSGSAVLVLTNSFYHHIDARDKLIEKNQNEITAIVNGFDKLIIYGEKSNYLVTQEEKEECKYQGKDYSGKPCAPEFLETDKFYKNFSPYYFTGRTRIVASYELTENKLDRVFMMAVTRHPVLDKIYTKTENLFAHNATKRMKPVNKLIALRDDVKEIYLANVDT